MGRMSVRTKLLGVMILVNLAIVLAGLVIAPSLDVDRDLESDLLGRSNRISMSVVLQRAVVDVLREAGAIRLAVDAGKDPGAAIAGLQSARAVVRNQISFMPVRADPGVDALRKFITARDAQLEILLIGRASCRERVCQ